MRGGRGEREGEGAGGRRGHRAGGRALAGLQGPRASCTVCFLLVLLPVPRLESAGSAESWSHPPHFVDNETEAPTKSSLRLSWTEHSGYAYCIPAPARTEHLLHTSPFPAQCPTHPLAATKPVFSSSPCSGREAEPQAGSETSPRPRGWQSWGGNAAPEVCSRTARLSPTAVVPARCSPLLRLTLVSAEGMAAPTLGTLPHQVK